MVKNQHNNTIHLIVFLCTLFTISTKARAQDCVYSAKGNDIIPQGKCAPVDVEWTVLYRGVDDNGTGNVQIQYDWNDGNPVELVDAILTDATQEEWTAVHYHTYPNTGDLCNYHPRATLVINGVVCTSSIQEQIVTVWDTDDQNGGELVVTPQVYPICYGNGATFHFTDASQWNCTPPDENDVVNNEDRWIQWIYGTGGTTINKAEVDGTVKDYPWSGPIEHIPGPIESPIAPYNTSLEITIPDDRDVGEFFEVTLRNWNVCNPYDDNLSDGLPPVDEENGDYAPVTITAMAIIVDLPDATITDVPDVCESDDPFFLIPIQTGGVWSGAGITNTKTGLFDPSVAGAGTHTIYYNITDDNACSDAGSINITVLSAPTTNINQNSDTNLCPGIVLNLDGSPSGGLEPYTHLWKGDTSPLSSTSIVDPQFTTTTIGEYEIVYRVEDANTCWDEDTITIDVEDVSIYFSDNTIEACLGEKLELDPDPTGGSEIFVSHLWEGTRTDLLSATDIQTPEFDASELGTFQFTYTYTVVDSYGCTDSDIITITVYEKPTANAGNDINECGLQTTLNAIPSIGTGLWKIVSGPGILAFQDFSLSTSLITADTYGTYILRWIEENNSCTDSADISVTFSEKPVPSVMADKDTCGLSLEITAYPHVGSGTWTKASGPGEVSFADASLASTSVSVDAEGTYKLAWVETNDNCTGSDTVTLQFFQQPIADFALPPTISCTPLEINFENNSLYADTYFWNFNNGTFSSEENPTVTYYNNSTVTTSYEISLITQTKEGCVDTMKASTIVAPSPISYFEVNNQIGCSPLTSNFLNKSQGATSYEWIFDNDDSSLFTTDATQTFTNSELYTLSYEINLVATNSYSCKDTSSQFVTVYPNQEFDLTATPNSSCAPVNVDFVASPGAYSYNWDFGDGDLITGSYLYKKLFTNETTNKETHTVTLYTTSIYGCLDTAQTSVTIIPSPTTYFEPNDFSVCSPKLVEFTNHTENITHSYWDFGDETSTNTDGNASVEHTYTNSTFIPVDYKIRLITENAFGCKDSMDGYTSVNPNVEAVITGSDEGCAPLQVSFGNESIGATNFLWDYGDGNSSSGYLGLNSFTNNTTNSITYTVSMIATSVYGCSDTAYTSATVHATPTVDFTINPDYMQMPESTVSLDNLTLGDTWSYEWNFGDNSSSTEAEPGNHVYDTSGNFTITLRAYSSYCENSAEKSIVIIPNIPSVEYGPTTNGCPALTVEFYSEATDAESYYWEFGDGNISSEINPTHTYYTSGEYTVTLTVTGPGGQMIKDDVIITVYPQPTALFEAYPKVVTIPSEKVSFVNQSIGATNYLWDFGNGDSSVETNPAYEYTEVGNYEVSLEATNDYGCTHSYTLNESIVAEQGGEINFPNAFTPNPDGPSSSEYTYGDKNNYVFYPVIQKGVEEYKMQIYTRWGELIFESHDIKTGWNGYFNGRICSQGVYIWKVTCRFSTGEVKVYTGDVTLLR